jgi:hypothetical protein
MLILPHAVESIRSRETAAPRSIVGFLLALYSVLMVGAVATVVGLVSSSQSGLVVYVLGFIGLITVALCVAVLVITWKDPSRLMLGEVSGREYAALRYIKVGDDVSGERAERILSGSIIDGGLAEEQPSEALLELESQVSTEDRPSEEER